MTLIFKLLALRDILESPSFGATQIVKYHFKQLIQKKMLRLYMSFGGLIDRNLGDVIRPKNQTKKQFGQLSTHYKDTKIEKSLVAYASLTNYSGVFCNKWLQLTGHVAAHMYWAKRELKL